ncbi:hypothetical protein [Leptolyngbya sp. GGD]|uniref:hypothetical protein n=1 Tax=Leptolyngbya sp. GGD TaxID=2997907 RepID=UPI00227CF18F|nr:hypothetical protein [Leptolyngbya sp. GGD]MCY6490928.1 hypothetical protein [Leptolyngbya sp. GGD]
MATTTKATTNSGSYRIDAFSCSSVYLMRSLRADTSASLHLIERSYFWAVYPIARYDQHTIVWRLQKC